YYNLEQKQKMNKIFFLGMMLLLSSCSQIHKEEKIYESRIDVRFGERFFSILISEKGQGFAIKGRSSNYFLPFEINSSDTSKLFAFNDINSYFKNIEKLKVNPIIKDQIPGGPRAEIYYYGEKVYDTYFMNKEFFE